MLVRWLGTALEKVSVEYAAVTLLMLYDIVKESCPMVAQIHVGELARVIDRAGLSAWISRDLLHQRLEALY